MRPVAHLVVLLEKKRGELHGARLHLVTEEGLQLAELGVECLLGAVVTGVLYKDHDIARAVVPHHHHPPHPGMILRHPTTQGLVLPKELCHTPRHC